MSALIEVPRAYDRLPQFLLSRISCLPESQEYRALSGLEAGLPGIVCAAVGRLLQRLQETPQVRPLAAVEKRCLYEIYSVLEAMAESQDSLVVNALQIEVFENFACSEAAMARIVSQMGPKALGVYQELKW